MGFVQPEEKYIPGKRTEEQRKADLDYLYLLLKEFPEGTSMFIHDKLMEEVARRGDQYEVHYVQTAKDIRGIKSGLLREAGMDIRQELDETLYLINEQIKLCLTEINRRMKDREIIEKEITSLTIKDLKDVPKHVKEIFQNYGGWFNITKDKSKIIQGGSDTREPMDMLYKWVKAKREVLGLDAPTKSLSKKEVLIKREITPDMLREKYKQLDDPELFTSFIEIVSGTNEEEIPELEKPKPAKKKIKKNAKGRNTKTDQTGNETESA